LSVGEPKELMLKMADHTLDLADLLFCAKYQVVSRKNLPAAVKQFIHSRRDGFRTILPVRRF